MIGTRGEDEEENSAQDYWSRRGSNRRMREQSLDEVKSWSDDNEPGRRGTLIVSKRLGLDLYHPSR